MATEPQGDGVPQECEAEVSGVHCLLPANHEGEHAGQVTADGALFAHWTSREDFTLIETAEAG